MADISLVCVREDAWKADLLTAALERYGFTVCRSASVFEDFTGYAAVVVLLSPGAARSDLVMGTAARALDWGKLIPVFVNLCHLPDRLAGVALHDLAAWDGNAEDPVVRAIAYHAQRLAGLPGKPGFGPGNPQRRVRQRDDIFQEPQIEYDPGFGGAEQGYHGYAPAPAYQPRPAPVYNHVQVQHHQPYDFEGNYGRSYNAQREPYFVAAAGNDLEAYTPRSNTGYVQPLDVQVSVSPNDAARRRAYFMDTQSFAESRGTTIDYNCDDTPNPPRRPMPGLFSVVISAFALLSMTWFEEARTHEYVPLHATPAAATASLSSPTGADPGNLPRKSFADAR